CLPGFKQAKSSSAARSSSSLRCTSPCEQFQCAKNAICIVSEHLEPICRCPVGQTGNPWAGGSGCHSLINCGNLGQRSCPAGMRCQGSICVHVCGGDEDKKQCGVGAVCDPVTQDCVCRPYQIGDPHLLCGKLNLKIKH